MKLLTKLFIGFSVFIVLSQIFSLSYFILVPSALAQEDSGAPDITGAIIRVPFWDLPAELKTFSFEPCPQECLAGDSADACQTKQNKTCLNIPWIAMYIGAAYRYAVVLGSILAVFMIMLGGVLYSIGGINQNMIKTGKDFISGAVVGLILLLGSYILLNTINPNFVSLKPVKIEVVKEQGMIKTLSCTEAVAQGYAVDEPNWKTTNTCGEEFAILYQGTDTTKQVAGQKCTSDSCGNTGLACIKMVETGSYQCKSAAIYGKIIYPGALTLAGCGLITEALSTKGFYIDELQLMKLNLGEQATGGEQAPIPVTAIISVGPGKDSYLIEKNALGPFEPSDRFFLWISVNDAAWSIWSLGMTIDDDFYAAGKTKNLDGINEVVPIVFCGEEKDSNIFGISPTDKGVIAFSIPALTGAQLKSAANGVRWDINITKEFFNCQAGKTKEAPKIDCPVSSFGNVGKEGDSCIGVKDTCQAGLICNSKTKVCNKPGEANAQCGENKDCAAEYFCNNQFKCEAVGSEGLSCDTEKDKSCATGLICTDQDELKVMGKPICVAAPKSCVTDADCKIVADGWADGSCDTDNKVCDCNLDSACAAGYICANNGGNLYGENDSCVKKP